MLLSKLSIANLRQRAKQLKIRSSPTWKRADYVDAIAAREYRGSVHEKNAVYAETADAPHEDDLPYTRRFTKKDGMRHTQKALETYQNAVALTIGVDESNSIEVSKEFVVLCLKCLQVARQAFLTFGDVVMAGRALRAAKKIQSLRELVQVRMEEGIQ